MNNLQNERPLVGIGVILVNSEEKILVGKRKGSHAPHYSIPGGHLEAGETFEACAEKEIREETGLIIRNPHVICVTNNLRTFREEGKHYISVTMLVREFAGTPELLEPDKCEGWFWVDPHNLPQPHFDASEGAVSCFLNGNICFQSK